jgi:hypothetical protein
MDTKLKYVRLKEYNQIIIFPCITEHSNFKYFNCISAGFCYVRDNKVSCFGESYSLDLKSDEKEDSLRATEQLFGIDAMLELEESFSSNGI